MSETLRRSFVLLTLTAAAMSALLCFLPAAGHDQLWFLLMAHRWLSGAVLYGPQIFDSNPPMVIWLSAVVQFTAVVLHVETTLVAKSLILVIATGIALFSSRLLSRVWRPIHASERPALLFAFIVLFLVVPARDLGQRDALAVLLAFPYVLASARAPGSRALGIPLLCGLLAGLAFCLKPQDALIAVAVELGLAGHLWTQTDSPRAALVGVLKRPELPALLLCGALYLLAIHHFAPLYFSEALPILRETYWAIGGLSLPALLWQAIELIVLMLAATLLQQRFRPASPAIRQLFFAAAGAFLAYLVQGTGWYYQQLPAIDLFGVALALLLLDGQQRRPVHPPRWIVPALAGMCLLAVALTTHFSGYPFTRDRAFAITSPSAAFFADLPPGTPVAVLTTSVDEAMMPVERYHLTWAQRTNNLWLLPAILRSERPDAHHPPAHKLTPLTLARLDGMQHRWMVEDLTRWRPQLILVERCQDPSIQCQTLEDRHDNLLAWFQRDAAFRNLWQSYRLVDSGGRFDAYTLKAAPLTTRK